MQIVQAREVLIGFASYLLMFGPYSSCLDVTPKVTGFQPTTLREVVSCEPLREEYFPAV